MCVTLLVTFIIALIVKLAYIITLFHAYKDIELHSRVVKFVSIRIVTHDYIYIFNLQLLYFLLQQGTQEKNSTIYCVLLYIESFYICNVKNSRLNCRIASLWCTKSYSYALNKKKCIFLSLIVLFLSSTLHLLDI